MKKSREELELMAATLGGIVIWNVLPGSASAQADIGYGDILLNVNGMQTPTIDDYIKARALKEDGATVQIFRDGRVLTFELSFGKRMSMHEAALLIAGGDVSMPPALGDKKIMSS